MSIRVQCSNGHRLAAREEVAGKRIKCPKCGDIVAVPAPVVEEVIDLSMDDLIDDIPQAGGAAAPTSSMPTDTAAQSHPQAPVADDPFGGLPPVESTTADSRLEPPSTENLFELLPEFPAGTQVPPAQQTPALAPAQATPQPVSMRRGPASPAMDVTETDRLTPGIIAAGIASLTSLIVGLVVMSMLLIGRGDRSTQVAQAIPAERATSEDSAPESVEPQPARRPQQQQSVPLATDPKSASQSDEANNQTAASSAARARHGRRSGSPNQSGRAGDAESSPATATSFTGTIHSRTLGTNKSSMPMIAFDRRTGDVAVTDQNGQTAIYRAASFDGDKNAISRLESRFDEGAEYLVFKPWNDRTLLLASDGKNVWIYDAASGMLFNDPEGIANPIEVSRPGLYSSESPRDKRFYTAGSEVVLSPYTEERPITNSSKQVTIGVSPSGRMIFGTYPTFSFPATLGDGYGSLGHVRAVGHLPMDPTDQYWKLSDKFVKWDGATAVRVSSDRGQRVPGNLLAYVPDSPWTIFATENGLSLVHRESLETRDVMPMVDSDQRLGQHNTRGYVDQKNNRFLLVTANTLSSIPLGSLQIPDEPLLGVEIDLPPVIRPGVEVEATVRAAPGIEFSLHAAPDGATLGDDRFAWTPSHDQIGHHDLVFRCKAGPDLSDQKVAVFVSELGVDLPFSVSRSFLSADAAQALAYSSIGINDQHRFAVIDTKSREYRISADSIAGAVRDACFDGSEIYLLMNTYELHVFDATTLRQKSRYYYGIHDLHRRVRRSPPLIFDSLRLLNDNLVVRNESRLTYFHRNDLSRADAVDPIDDPKHPAKTSVGDGLVQFGPALFDAQGQFQRFLRLPNLVDIDGDRIHDNQPQFDSSVRRDAVLDGKALYLHESENGLSLGKGGPLLIYGKRERDPVVNAAGECVSVSVGGALFLIHPYDVGWLPRPNASNELPVQEQPLRIVGKSLPVVASGQRKTRFQVDISGGAPPYRINSEIQDVNGQTAFQLNDRTGVGTLDGAALTAAITRNAFESARRISGMLGIAEVHGRDLADAIKSYREFASKTCSRYAKVTFKEFPVAVTLNISVSDSKGNNARLQHAFALEVPVRTMLAQIKDESRFQVRSEPADAPLQRNQNLPNRQPTIVANIEPLQTVTITKSTGDLRTDYFKHLRRFQLDDGLGKLSVKHRALVHTLPRVGRSLRQRQPVTLTLANREAVTGTVNSVTRDRIEMQVQSRRSTFHPSEFSPDSLVQLHGLYDRSLDSGARSRDHAEMLESMKEYRWKNGFLLPHAIDSPDGTPLLSWRVLLLPYFGYAKLFSLFRLDEPWDSAHNRQLIPYMPREYVTHADAAGQGLTALEILSGDQTLFPPERLIRHSSIGSNQFRGHVIGVVKRADLASEWTKPSDIRLTENKLPYELIQEEEERSGQSMSLLTYDLGRRKMGPIPGQEQDSRRRSRSRPEQHQIFITDDTR